MGLPFHLFCPISQFEDGFVDIEKLRSDNCKLQMLHGLTKEEDEADKAIMKCIVAHNLAFNWMWTPEFKEACHMCC